MNPFDFVNDILISKKNILNEETEKEYKPFLINRSLSYHYDCIFFVNEMNIRPFASKNMQNSFLINTIRSHKRPFAKWIKSEKSEDLQCIKTYFGYSDDKAKQTLSILSDEQIQQLKEKTEIGGLRK